MFSTIIDAIQGAPDTDSEEEDEPEHQALHEDRQGGAAGQQQAASGGSFNFWNMAATVADTVKASAAEIASTVKTTDWRAELGAFGKDVLDETEELGQSAVAAVEQAIDNVEQLPQHAVTALPVLDERRREVTTQLGRQLGRFGQGFVAGTHDLFEQVKDAIQTELSDNPGDRPRRAQRALTGRSGGVGSGGSSKYSRLEAEVAAMQRDSGTYCDEPPDTDAYEAWLKDFNLEARRPEIEAIIADNTFMAELQSRIVPLIVEYNVFWTRYFYRLHLLREKHSQRQQLAQRAQRMAAEEVGWGDDEDDAASPTSAALPPAPGTALAATAAATGTASATTPGVCPAGESAATAETPGQVEAATVSQPEPVAQPTAINIHPVPEPDEVATASDSTDGGAGGGERWTVVSTGTPTKASAAAAAALPPPTSPGVPASAGASPKAQVPASLPKSSSPAEGSATGAAVSPAGKLLAKSDAAASKSEAAKPPQKPAVAAVVDDDDDDDLADVEVPEGGDGSEVDEDWGSWGAEDEN